MKLFIPRLADNRFLGGQAWFDRRERAQLESVTPAKPSPEAVLLEPEKLGPPTEEPACKKNKD